LPSDGGEISEQRQPAAEDERHCNDPGKYGAQMIFAISKECEENEEQTCEHKAADVTASFIGDTARARAQMPAKTIRACG
jgi:hypothetical protein